MSLPSACHVQERSAGDTLTAVCREQATVAWITCGGRRLQKLARILNKHFSFQLVCPLPSGTHQDMSSSCHLPLAG